MEKETINKSETVEKENETVEKETIITEKIAFKNNWNASAMMAIKESTHELPLKHKKREWSFSIF